MTIRNPPALLIFGGLDPSGGAGLTADIQTASAFSIHPLAVATTLTVQSVERVYEARAQDPTFIVAQAQNACHGWQIKAIKLGVVPNKSCLRAIVDFIQTLEVDKIVIDPVVKASSGYMLSQAIDGREFLNTVSSLKPLLVPNQTELQHLCSTPQTAPERLLGVGLAGVLVTDGENDDDTSTCHHVLYTNKGHKEYIHPRLNGCYHGSGCTLATAIASQWANKKTLDESVAGGIEYVYQTLNRAQGKYSSLIPNRLPIT